jgi:hypothetical protein
VKVTSLLNQRLLWFTGALIIMVLLGALSYTHLRGHAGGNSSIHACVHERTGVVKIVGPQESCPSKWMPQDWAIQGPLGTTLWKDGAGSVTTTVQVGVGTSNVGGARLSAVASPGKIGVLARSTHRALVATQEPTLSTSCAGRHPLGYAVGGCADDGDALFGRTSTGNILVGQSPAGVDRVRIDGTGKGFFNGGTQSSGADFAESLQTTDATATLEASDVLVIDSQNPMTVMESRQANSRLVAGVYSTSPSVLAIGDHDIDDSLEGEVLVAIVGIVPTKVTAENGPIHVGDLLVTSSTPGRAMKAQPVMLEGTEIFPTGAVLGKALEPLEGALE